MMGHPTVPPIRWYRDYEAKYEAARLRERRRAAIRRAGWLFAGGTVCFASGVLVMVLQ